MRRVLILLAIVIVAGGGFAWWWVFHNKTVDAEGDFDWELTPPLPGATPVAATKKMEGFYFAGSRIQDDQAPRGVRRMEQLAQTAGGQRLG